MKKKIVLLFLMSALGLTACGSSSTTENNVNSGSVENSTDAPIETQTTTPETETESTSAEESSEDEVEITNTWTCTIYDSEKYDTFEGYLANVTLDDKDDDGNYYMCSEGAATNGVLISSYNAETGETNDLINLLFIKNLEVNYPVDYTDYDTTEYDGFTCYTKVYSEENLNIDFKLKLENDLDLNLTVNIAYDGTDFGNFEVLDSTEEYINKVEKVLEAVQIEIVEG
jgi:hypothetical protein